MKNNDNFIEVDFFQKNKAGNVVCGDSFMSQKLKGEGRIISVLSTIEKKWDPYQLDYPIDSNLKNYVNVWFHLVTVALKGVSEG